MSSSHKKMSRRQFLARSTQTAAGLIAAGAFASCTGTATAPCTKIRALGANERINMAVIGIRGRGEELLTSFAQIPNVRVKTLCDIDENLFAERARELETGFQAGSIFSSRGGLSNFLRLSFAHYGEEQIVEGIRRMRPLFD